MKRFLSMTIVPALLLGAGNVYAQLDKGRAADAPPPAPPPKLDARGGAEAKTPAGDVESRSSEQGQPPQAQTRGNVRTPAGDAQGKARARTDSGLEAQAEGRANTPDARTEIQGGARTQPQVRGQVGGRANVNGHAGARGALGVTLNPGAGGVVIANVSPNSPAGRAGLRAGDRIIRLNGDTYDAPDVFINGMAGIGLDDDSEIVYLRGGQEYTTTFRPMAWDQVYGAQVGGAPQPYTTLRPDFNGQPMHGAAPGYGHQVYPQGGVQGWYPNTYGWSPAPRGRVFRGNFDDDDDDCDD